MHEALRLQSRLTLTAHSRTPWRAASCSTTTNIMNRPIPPGVSMFLGAALAFGASIPSFRPSATSIRHDPDREKTAKDLARIEAARIKRTRRESKRGKI